MKEIFTSGYPRSGSTWLNRLLGDLLDSPLQAEGDSVVKYWGSGRDGGYLIRKTHIFLEEDKKNIMSRGPVIFIMRDPRDMIVSISFYRNGQPISDVIQQVCEDALPHMKNKGYTQWVDSWLETGDCKTIVRYERLHSNGVDELIRLAEAVGAHVTREWAREVYDRQEFSRVLEANPQHHHSMRKGVVGDWVNHFTIKDAELLDSLIGEFMLRYGYVENRDWWKSVE